MVLFCLVFFILKDLALAHGECLATMDLVAVNQPSSLLGQMTGFQVTSFQTWKEEDSGVKSLL